MRVMALDISKRNTGWACDGADGCPPLSGSWKAPLLEQDLGAVGQAFERRLFKAIKEHQIEHVVYEAPHVANSGQGNSKLFFNEQTTIVLIGLVFCAMTIAYSSKIGHSKGHVGTWRKYFLGSARWDNPKAAAKARCDELGWSYESEDAAESMGLWAWRKNQFDETFVLPKTKIQRD